MSYQLSFYNSKTLESYIYEVLVATNCSSATDFGSQYVGCANEDSDIDYLLLVPSRPQEKDLQPLGWYPDSTDPLYGDDFSSWRNVLSNVNLVFTDKPGYYKASLYAATFCKKYKVFNKADRIKLHEAFRSLIESTQEVLS